MRGSGIAEVVAIGPRSEIGKIGQSLSSVETEPPRLRAQTARLVRLSAVGGGWSASSRWCSTASCAAAGSMRCSRELRIGMSMLPEEFPVVLTVFMAMGAWRISRARVLTRRAAAIETLGSATVLCTDKTGTLTENRMSIAELRTQSGEARFTGDQAAARRLPEEVDDSARLRLPRQCARTVRSDGEGLP